MKPHPQPHSFWLTGLLVFIYEGKVTDMAHLIISNPKKRSESMLRNPDRYFQEAFTRALSDAKKDAAQRPAGGDRNRAGRSRDSGKDAGDRR